MQGLFVYAGKHPLDGGWSFCLSFCDRPAFLDPHTPPHYNTYLLRQHLGLYIYPLYSSFSFRINDILKFLTVSQAAVKTQYQPSSRMPPQQHLKIFERRPTERCQSLQHFTLFPKLPKELRLEIWRKSMQCERIIKVSIDSVPEVVETINWRALQAMSGRFIRQVGTGSSEETADASIARVPHSCHQHPSPKLTSPLEE